MEKTELVNLDGVLQPAATAGIPARCAGFRYGEGFFETILVRNGAIALRQRHAARIVASARLLGYAAPAAEALLDDLIALAEINGCASSARGRICFFAGERSSGDELHCLMEAEPFESEAPAGLRLGVYPDEAKMASPFGRVKHNNYAPFLRAARFSKANGFDDCLLMNQAGRVCETSVCNLFAVRAGVLVTPPLDEGCVDGVMRREVLAVAAIAGIDARESPVTLEELASSEEIFLTNALRGIRPVAWFSNRSFGSGVALRLGQMIRHGNG